jgi:hypothetical protein
MPLDSFSADDGGVSSFSEDSISGGAARGDLEPESLERREDAGYVLANLAPGKRLRHSGVKDCALLRIEELFVGLGARIAPEGPESFEKPLSVSHRQSPDRVEHPFGAAR